MDKENDGRDNDKIVAEGVICKAVGVENQEITED